MSSVVGCLQALQGLERKWVLEISEFWEGGGMTARRLLCKGKEYLS